MNDVVGGGEVEAEAAGLEADEKEIAVAGLKGVDREFTLFPGGTAVEILVADTLAVEIFANQCEVADELAEHQGLVAARQQFLDDRGKDP